ncbi:MAG: DNA polymerase [Candidatus Lokiarchaeota archaeon]
MNYPDLSSSKIISFDIETYDPLLEESGPGVYRNDGCIIGVSIANEQGFSEYYNIQHPDVTPELKLKNTNYIKYIMNLDCKKLGTFILYDLDWIENWWSIPINGELHDINVAEALIDENRKLLGIPAPYSLDSLASKYLGKRKHITEIQSFCNRHNLKGNPKKWLWKMNSNIVSSYGKIDALLPLEIFKKQWKIMYDQDLLPLYSIEMKLHRLLLQMRKIGVRIDKKKLAHNIDYVFKEIKNRKSILYGKYGEFNYNSSKQIAKVFDKLNIPYSLTAKGNPNIDKAALKYLINKDIEIAKEILEVRAYDKTLHTFLINAFNNHMVNGRLHCSFYPLSTDKYGTKSGRFSSADPNLQQVPSEDPHKKLCRSILISEEEHDWVKADYSQIEYRFMAHYAEGPKSDEIRRRYNEEPNTDYHQMIVEWTGLSRKRSKNLDFGASYFMGAYTCSQYFGWSIEEARDLLEMYFNEVPFIKPTRKKVVKVAKARGFIKTILNRRARVTQQMRDKGKEYSMFNRLIQGSAADLLKKAMYDCYEAGLFNTLIPHLTVHDELDVSKPRTKEGNEAIKEMKYIMENCIKLKVPIVVDMEIGDNWGELQDYNEEYIQKELL